MMAAQLPPEVVQHILCFLPDDPRVIRPLALVSRTWTVAAQNTLYEYICIEHKNQWSRLHKRLHAFPHLRPLVRSLHARLHISYDNRKKQRFLELFPNLSAVRFSSQMMLNSDGISFLYRLVNAAPLTLRRLDLVFADPDMMGMVAEFFQAYSHIVWEQITLRLEMGYSDWELPNKDCLGSPAPAIRSLTIVERFNHGWPWGLRLVEKNVIRSLDTVVFRLHGSLGWIHRSFILEGSVKWRTLTGVDQVTADNLEKLRFEFHRYETIPSEEVDELVGVFGSAKDRGIVEIDSNGTPIS